MPSKKILVVDDERDIAELIAFNLEREGYEVTTANTGEEGLSKAQSIIPDLIVLDIMLPGLNGLDVCRHLKSEHETQKIPIIMLTAKDEDIDVVTGLELGADDYLTKPFSPKILIARIRSVLRRQRKETKEQLSVMKYGNIVIYSEKHQVTVHGEAVNLTHTEFEILCILARRPGWVFSRSQLIDSLRDGQQVITDRAIDVQIVNLRKKLGNCSDYVQTVRGVGYRMKEVQ